MKRGNSVNRKISNILKRILGVILLLVLLCGVYYWEFYGGRESLLYVDVLVANQSIPKGTIINSSMISKVKMDSKHVVESEINNKDDIIGKETVIKIPYNAQISNEYIKDDSLLADEDEYIFSIPNEWLKSFPQTIRRRDLILLYPVYEDESLKDNTEKLNNETDMNFEAVVAYVKDRANREVVDTDTQNTRMNASSNIASVELLISKDSINKMYEFINQNYKFVMIYR